MWHSAIPTISDELIKPLIHFKHTSIDGFIGINARPAIIPNEVICSNVLEMAEHGVIKLFMEPVKETVFLLCNRLTYVSIAPRTVAPEI